METKKNVLNGIKYWSKQDRPREKAIDKGLSALTDAELLAIIIGTGTKEHSALDLARLLLAMVDNDLYALDKLSLQELSTKIKGIGMAKAVGIAVALELGKRRKLQAQSNYTVIRESSQIAEIFEPMLSSLEREEFWVLYLNNSAGIVAKYLVGSGGVNRTAADVRIILKKAVETLSSAIVLCHNHPSGNPYPSESDRTLTKQISDAAKLLNIKVLDHIIIAGSTYYSFSDEGLLF